MYAATERSPHASSRAGWRLRIAIDARRRKPKHQTAHTTKTGANRATTRSSQSSGAGPDFGASSTSNARNVWLQTRKSASVASARTSGVTGFADADAAGGVIGASIRPGCPGAGVARYRYFSSMRATPSQSAGGGAARKRSHARRSRTTDASDARRGPSASSRRIASSKRRSRWRASAAS